MPEHIRLARNRREFLTDCFCGMGSLAFASMMAETQARAAHYNPLAPKPPNMPDKAKAKAFIFVYMAGGPSHLETWDPKPLLNQLDGQKRPAEFGDVKYQNVNSDSRILGCKRTFKKYGKSGIEVSDLFPHQAEVVDDLCVIRSMHGDMVVHSAAQYQMMTGRIIPGFPAMGELDGLWPGLRGRIATGLCRDARLPRAHRKPAFPCINMDFCLPSISPRSCAPAAGPC